MSSKNVVEHPERWRQVFLGGHEIGNHTFSHPCRSAPNSLTTWTALQIRNDVAKAAAWLNENVGPDSFRTFAYPCGDTMIGPPGDEKESPYAMAVRACCFAARLAGGRPNDPARMPDELLQIGAQTGKTNDDFITYAEQTTRA